MTYHLTVWSEIKTDNFAKIDRCTIWMKLNEERKYHMTVDNNRNFFRRSYKMKSTRLLSASYLNKVVSLCVQRNLTISNITLICVLERWWRGDQAESSSFFVSFLAIILLHQLVCKTELCALLARTTQVLVFGNANKNGKCDDDDDVIIIIILLYNNKKIWNMLTENICMYT